MADHRDIKVQIFASDISAKSISKARTGIYSAQDVQHISEKRLATYFTKLDGRYHIIKTIRDMCVFAVQNVISDPPFARLDLITCRNVLIYLKTPLQNKVLESFHYALKKHGILVLGRSESASAIPHLFENTGSQANYFFKTKQSKKDNLAINLLEVNIDKDFQVPEIKLSETDFAKAFSDCSLGESMTGVIVNGNLEIVDFHGTTRDFLEPPPGKPDFNILKMAREGLRYELRNALLNRKPGETVVKKDIVVQGQPLLATFQVIPLITADHHVMIIFHRQEHHSESKKIIEELEERNRIRQLERELEQMRDDIRRVTEKQQTALRQLQATSSELMSKTEELQAIDEELETSNEELQCNNEELICVNDELLDRQKQLIALRKYSELIVRTIWEPLIIIDHYYTVQVCNPAYHRTFNSNSFETENLCFFEIDNHLWDIPELKEILRRVFHEGIAVEGFRLEVNCVRLGRRIVTINIVPIEDSKPVPMALITFDDVTELEQSNEQLLLKNADFQRFNEQLKVFSDSASRDLEELINKIKMFASRILQLNDLSGDAEQHTNRIIAAVDRMEHLVSELVSYSNASLGHEKPKKVNLNVMFKKLLTEMGDQIKANNAVILVKPLPELTVMPLQVKQLFSSLISNSLKFGRPDTAPEIQIWCEEVSQDQMAEMGGNPSLSYHKIVVRDNGMGYDSGLGDKIFEPFFKAFSMDSNSGSGLGLALAKKVVVNHGGFISYDSVAEQGTSFQIFLPRQTLI